MMYSRFGVERKKCGNGLTEIEVDLTDATLTFLVCCRCRRVHGIDVSKSKLTAHPSRSWSWGHLGRWIFTLQQVPFRPEKLSVLDIGAAPGYLTRLVKHLFGYEVYGLDSSHLIRQAGANFDDYVSRMRQAGVVIRDCDVDRDRFPFPDGEFDLVLCTEVMEHLHNPRWTLSEALRVLRKGGTLVLSTPNSARASNRIKRMIGMRIAFHGVKEYTPQELLGLVEEVGFSTTDMRFSDWSERRQLKKLRRATHRPQVRSAVSIILKYALTRLSPSLSSYMFLLATKRDLFQRERIGPIMPANEHPRMMDVSEG